MELPFVERERQLLGALGIHEEGHRLHLDRVVALLLGALPGGQHFDVLEDGLGDRLVDLARPGR